MRVRKPLVLLVPSLTLVLAAACEGGGDGGGSSGSFTTEAGVFEASTFDTFVPPIDAGADTTTPPPPGPVTVTVTTAAAPAANVRVLFHDATGAIVTDAMTDATGKASTSNTTVAMVSVLYMANGAPEFVTYLGVTPGDNLTVAAQLEVNVVSTGSWSTTFASNALTANATSFYTIAGNDCGNSLGFTITAAEDIAVYPTTCPGPPNSMLAYAVSPGETVAGYAFAKAIARPVGGNTVDIGPLTLVAPGTRSLSATNVPDDSEPQGSAVAIAGLEAYSFYTSSGTLTDPGGMTFPTPVGFADAYQSHVYISQGSGNGELSVLHVVRREVATAAATDTLTAIDFSTALPALTNVALGLTTPARPDFTVTSAAPQTATTGFVQMFWDGTVGSTWSFYFPGSLGSFKAPALPTDLASFAPTDGSHVTEAAVGSSSLVPDYTTSKLAPVDPADLYGRLNPLSPLPAAGTLKVNVLQQED